LGFGGLRGALGAHFPGPYKILRELTLSGTVVSGTRRPPTLVGYTRDRRSDGHRGLAYLTQKAGRLAGLLLCQDYCLYKTPALTNLGGLDCTMRILFLGDLVGRSGRNAVIGALPRLRERYGAHFVVVNGENAAGGFGITEPILIELLDAGADVVTTGNHVWDQREALVFIERHDRLLRPLNFPQGTPGKGAGLFKASNGAEVLVINAMGRVFMADLDCPFRTVERELEVCPLKTRADAILIDFHAEATSEKQAMGYFVDGRASCVIGTHTHVPTADEQILPLGTAYISDAGMCGDYDSVLGMEKAEPLQRFLTKIQTERFQPASGEATICGVAVETDDATGLACAIAPVRLGGRLAQVEPDFWLGSP
jgi:2',3'-cyclic-nucleotide 2'-phosphodiesterase